MGFLDKVKSGGGGSIEGAVTDVLFVKGWPIGEGGVFIDDEDDRNNTDNIYLVLRIMPEGGDEEAIRALYLGSGQFLVIEEDGAVLRGGEDGEVDEDQVPRLYSEGDVYKFIASLIEAGFPADSRFPDPEETKSIDFRALIGWRLRIVNEKDEEATKKFGKRTIKKGKSKGKERDREWTKVAKVLGEVENAKAGKGSAKKTDSKGKASKKEDADEDETPAIDTKTADKFLKEVLKSEGKEGAILRDKLLVAITRTFSKKKMDLNENADLRKFLTSEEYLVDAAERDVIDFDPSAKKQTISLKD